MHTGNLSLLGSEKYKNFIHILFNNSSHESVGGQPNSLNILMEKMFESFVIKKLFHLKIYQIYKILILKN